MKSLPYYRLSHLPNTNVRIFLCLASLKSPFPHSRINLLTHPLTFTLLGSGSIEPKVSCAWLWETKIYFLTANIRTYNLIWVPKHTWSYINAEKRWVGNLPFSGSWSEKEKIDVLSITLLQGQVVKCLVGILWFCVVLHLKISKIP